MENVDLNSLDGLSPKQIAEKIFTSSPASENSIQLIHDNDETDIIDIFEILITIFMEGIMTVYHNLDEAVININDVSLDHLYALSPWFKGFGFKLFVNEYDLKNNDESYINNYNDQYCKIVVRNSPENSFFVFNNIPDHYKFYINSKYAQDTDKENLKDIYSVFKINSKVYKIYFDFLLNN